MSRVAKQPITIPEGVKVELNDFSLGKFLMAVGEALNNPRSFQVDEDRVVIRCSVRCENSSDAHPKRIHSR